MDLIRAVRSDADFIARLLARNDALRAEYGIAPRQADGYYGESDPSLLAWELSDRAALIGERLAEEGYGEHAATILREAGYDAWCNEIGHVAIGCEAGRMRTPA